MAVNKYNFKYILECVPEESKADVKEVLLALVGKVAEDTVEVLNNMNKDGNGVTNKDISTKMRSEYAGIL